MNDLEALQSGVEDVEHQAAGVFSEREGIVSGLRVESRSDRGNSRGKEGRVVSEECGSVQVRVEEEDEGAEMDEVAAGSAGQRECKQTEIKSLTVV